MQDIAQQSPIDSAADHALFRKAPVLRELLIYLWNNRDKAVSEYAIGIDVLGRKPDFDPKYDSAVRVHVSRLRARLKEYYESAGAGDPVRISIPPGEYRLQMQAVESQAAVPRNPWRLAFIGATVGGALLLIDDVRLRLAPSAPTIEKFWQPMARKGRPVGIIVPAPLFFRWEKQPFVARDFRVSKPEDIGLSPILESLRREHGAPEVSHLYTIATDTLAASAVSRHLEDRGVPAPITDTPAATINLLPSHDAALFVGPSSSTGIRDLMDQLGFAFRRSAAGVNSGLIDRRAPDVSFPVTAHSPTRSTGHGLIARLPGKTPDTSVLIVGSVYNPALAMVLTEPAELAQFDEFLRANDAGKYFEAIIRYELDGNKVLDVRPVAARKLLIPQR